jgi:hypothetical protein
LPVQSCTPAAAAKAALGALAASAAALRQASGGDLPGCFAGVPYPRDRRGIRRSLASILAMCAAAALCGCSSLEDVTAWVSSAGHEILAALGCRRNALGVFTPPHPDTIVRVFTALGAQQLPDRAGAFLAGGRPGLAPSSTCAAGSLLIVPPGVGSSGTSERSGRAADLPL